MIQIFFCLPCHGGQRWSPGGGRNRCCGVRGWSQVGAAADRKLCCGCLSVQHGVKCGNDFWNAGVNPGVGWVVAIGFELLAGGSIPNQDTFAILPTPGVWENPRDDRELFSNPSIAASLKARFLRWLYLVPAGQSQSQHLTGLVGFCEIHLWVFVSAHKGNAHDSACRNGKVLHEVGTLDWVPSGPNRGEE